MVSRKKQRDLTDSKEVKSFAALNGKIMRAMSLVNRLGWFNGNDIKEAYPMVDEDDIYDAVSYMEQLGVLELRTAADKMGNVDVYAHEIEHIEIRITAKGVKLLTGSLADELISI